MTHTKIGWSGIALLLGVAVGAVVNLHATGPARPDARVAKGACGAQRTGITMTLLPAPAARPADKGIGRRIAEAPSSCGAVGPSPRKPLDTLVALDKARYACHETVSGTVNDDGGAPSSALYHSTSGGAFPATIAGASNPYAVSPVTVDQLGAEDGDDIWLTVTGSDASVHSSDISPLTCTPSVCVSNVAPLTGGCDNDAYFDDGETLAVKVLMANNEAYDLPTGFTAQLRIDPAHPNANATIVNGTAAWDAIGAGGAAYPNGVPFMIRYTANGGGPEMCDFQVYNIQATNGSWSGGGACAGNSFTEYANTNDSAVTTYVSESFDATGFPPANWTNTQVGGTGLWARTAGMAHPTMSPRSGAGMAEFASFTYASGTSARLVTPPFSLDSAARPLLTFYMTHDDTYANDDTIAVEVSTNGTDYTTLATYHRNDGLAAGQWVYQTVDLSAFIGQSTVTVSFLAASDNGDNMAIDDVTIADYTWVNDPQNCTTAAPALAFSDGDWMFDDQQCNGLSDWSRWIPSPDAGESGSLLIYLSNGGSENAYNVVGTLTCPSCPSGVQICKNTAHYGTIPYGTGYLYGPGDDGFRIALPTGLSAGADLPFVMTMTCDNSGYTPPTVDTTTSPQTPLNPRAGTRTAQGSCTVDPGITGFDSPTVAWSDDFAITPCTTGSSGRCGPDWDATAWTCAGVVVSSTAVSTPTGDGASTRLSVNSSYPVSSIWRRFSAEEIDDDVQFHCFVQLAAPSTCTFYVDYTADGSTFYPIASAAGQGTTAWTSFGGSVYWAIYSKRGTGYGPAAANAIFDNENFGIRLRAVRSSGSTSYFYIDDVEIAQASSVNQPTSCTGACLPPDQPALEWLVDYSPCVQNGIRAYYSESLGAESYNLVKDGTSVVTGYASGMLYNPGDASSHNYQIRAVNSDGTADSWPAQPLADAAGTGTPTVSGGSGPGSTLLTTEQSYSNYQWHKDGTAIPGANAYQYTVSAPAGCGGHNYTASYKQGACTGTSAPHNVNITGCGGGTVYNVPQSITPMKITKACVVTWDATNCPSTDYHLICGKGENLPTWTVEGGACGLGATGTVSWCPPDPSSSSKRFLWFFVVGDDGINTEGAWGQTSEGSTASGVCGMTAKNTTTCGTP